MPEFQTQRRVGHSAGDMFDLVADVERYPEFVPLCRSLVVRRREARREGREVLVADMTVAYRLISETFTSRVTLDRPNLAILVEYVNGPFSYLENQWGFTPVGEQATDVRFHIEYEFRSRTLGLLMGALFEATFRRFAEAFERRADQVYGRGTAGTEARTGPAQPAIPVILRESGGSRASPRSRSSGQAGG